MASVTVRVPATEQKDWKRSANLAGVTLSEWIRKRCANGAIAGIERETLSPTLSVPCSASAPDGVAGSAREAEAIPRSKGRCFHGKRKGTHCWQCPSGLAA